jgi:hypothetical protein
MSLGRSILGRRHVLPSVWFTLRQIQVEGTFPTGTYLVTVQHPIASEEGDLRKALYGSCLPVPPSDPFPSSNPADYDEEKAPGAIVLLKGENGHPVPITLNEGRTRRCLEVTNCGSRPIQVYHISNLAESWKQNADNGDCRLGPITISSRQIRNSSSTALTRTGTDWINLQARRFGSNREKGRSLTWSKSQGTRLSKGGI